MFLGIPSTTKPSSTTPNPTAALPPVPAFASQPRTATATATSAPKAAVAVVPDRKTGSPTPPPPAQAAPSPPPTSASGAAAPATRAVADADRFVQSVRTASAHVGGDVFVSLPSVRGGGAHPNKNKEFCSAGVVCFSAADGDNQSLTLRRPAVFVDDVAPRGPLPTCDGPDQRVVSNDGDGCVVFLNPTSTRHNLIDCTRADVLTLETEWPVLNAAFHPDAPGKIFVALTTPGLMEVHLVPSTPTSSTADVLVGAEATKRCHVLQLETGKPSKRDAGKLPHTIANERGKSSPIWADIAFIPKTPTAPTIVLALDSDGAVWGAPLAVADLDGQPVPRRGELALRLIIPADATTGAAAGQQSAATSFAWVLSDCRAGTYSCVIGRTSGVVDFITISEHGLASQLTRKPGTPLAERDRPAHVARIPVAGAHLDSAAGNLLGVRISQGQGPDDQHCLVVTVTPHSRHTAPTTPLHAIRNVTTAQVHLRLNYFVCLPIWDPLDDTTPCWKYLLDPDVPVASYDAAVPAPLCVPLPSTVVGGRRNDDGSIAPVPLSDLGGIPVLGYKTVAFIETHLLPPAEVSRSALAWHQPDGIIVNPMMVPLRHIVLSALHGHIALARADGLKFDAAPTGPLADSVRQLPPLAAELHLAALKSAHDHMFDHNDVTRVAPATPATTSAVVFTAAGTDAAAMETAIKPYKAVRTAFETRMKECSARELKLVDRVTALRKKFDQRSAQVRNACAAAETSRMTQNGIDSVYDLNDRLKEIASALDELEVRYGTTW